MKRLLSLKSWRSWKGQACPFQLFGFRSGARNSDHRPLRFDGTLQQAEPQGFWRTHTHTDELMPCMCPGCEQIFEP